jgi:hypothetical protein
VIPFAEILPMSKGLLAASVASAPSPVASKIGSRELQRAGAALSCSGWIEATSAGAKSVTKEDELTGGSVAVMVCDAELISLSAALVVG